MNQFLTAVRNGEGSRAVQCARGTVDFFYPGTMQLTLEIALEKISGRLMSLTTLNRSPNPPGQSF